MKKLKKLVYLLLVAIICSCAGVGYSFRGGNIPGKTFGIESFKNEASIVNPELINVLQDELRVRLSSESNLQFSDTKSDAVFIGTVTNYYIAPVQGTGNETVNLSRLHISVKITYINNVDHKNDYQDKIFSDYQDFETADDFNSKEEELVKSISEKLILQIYNSVLVDW